MGIDRQASQNGFIDSNGIKYRQLAGHTEAGTTLELLPTGGQAVVGDDGTLQRVIPPLAATALRLWGEYPDAELFTIVGDDVAARLNTWDRAPEVVEQSRMVVVDRPGVPVVLDPGIDWIRVEVPRLEVSSTDLRARWLDGRPLDYLVTEDVLAVISERGLYGSGEQ